MKRLIFAVGAIILSVAYFAEPGAAQEAGDLSGNWTFTMEPPPGWRRRWWRWGRRRRSRRTGWWRPPDADALGPG